MSSRAETLLARIDDPDLRAQIAAELEAVQGHRKFGLVFEQHLPESVKLTRVRPRRGLKAILKNSTTKDGQLLRIVRMRGSGASRVAECLPARQDVGAEPVEIQTHPVADLVVVAEFGDPIYPGLTQVGETVGPGTDDSAPSHLVLNAENHHALQALQWSHADSVDLIYIDPPYNTGNKTWQYNDHYIAAQDSFKHSKWLSFMEKRLILAHRLLKNSGAIMISIGDDEQHRLRMLMDQIFGERNQIAQLAVEMSTTSGPKTTNAQQGTIVKNVEYVLIYRKSIAFDEDVRHTPLYDSVNGWDKHYSLWLEEDGSIGNFYQALASDPATWQDISAAKLVKKSGEFTGAQAMDKLLALSESANEFIEKNLRRIARYDSPPVSAKNVEAPVGKWISIEADHRTYMVTKLKTGTINQIYSLDKNYRLPDENNGRLGRTVIRGDLWRGFHQDMGTVSREGGIAFNNGKKPIRLISQLIKWANNSPDAVILDFFGGSGTTAHAVASMNAADGGHRQAIVVTNNELPSEISSKLLKEGLQPGEYEYEAHGVFRSVTKPRLENVFSNGLPGRVTFFDLEYLDADRIADDRAFEAVLPMLWIRSGARGELKPISDEPWLINGNYAVLRNASQWQAFSKTLTDDITYVFIVTNSPSEFTRAAQSLPLNVEAVRLYEKYLTTFEINTGEEPK